MQKLTWRAHEFCSSSTFDVNLLKTEIMVFSWNKRELNRKGDFSGYAQ